MPVNGLKRSCVNTFIPVVEIWVGKSKGRGDLADPAHPFKRTRRNFYKVFRGVPRSRKLGQPDQPGSQEEALGASLAGPERWNTNKYLMGWHLAIHFTPFGSEMQIVF